MFQPNFVTFTNLEITERNPINGNAFKGNQNGGFNFVRFSDGSGGIEKHMEDWTGNKTGRLYKGEVLAAQEYLAARVGEVMNAPIRDCLFTGSDAKNVIMPYIEGKSGLEDDDEFLPSNAQGVALKLFDFITANADRRPKNWINTPDGRIVGIDHALCNFRPRQAKPELVTEFWNAGVTADALLILRPKLESLRPKFSTIGMDDKFIIMMRNLDVLLEALSVVEVTVENVLHLSKSENAFTPPAGVQQAAKRALEWMADGKAGGGFTSVGRKRASDLARGAHVSEVTIRRMKAYFDRHQPDKNSPHWNEPSPGKVAWYAWGGDAGYSWAKKVVAHLNREDEIKKGDVAGHPFHGNQYENGESGKAFARSKDFILNNVFTTRSIEGSEWSNYTINSEEKENYTENLSKIISNPEGFKKALAEFPTNGKPDPAKAVMAMLGNLGKPSVVSGSEFSKGDEYQRLFTGLSAPVGKGAEVVAGFAHSDNPTYGGGIYGTAFYTSELPSEAVEYANERGDARDHMLLQMRLDWSNPDASNAGSGRSVNYNFSKEANFNDLLKQNGFDKGTADLLAEGLNETSSDALSGYKYTNSGYVRVYDRSILQMSDTYASWGETAPTSTGDQIFANQKVNTDTGVSAEPINRALAKGDVAGHEFHGNQWTQIGGHTADEHPKKWAKAIISELQAGRSPSIGQHELGILLNKVEQKQLEGSLTADVTNLRIDGTNLMGQEGLGYTREEMPQIPPKMREEFVADLEKQGISSTRELVDPRSLQPSQSEIGLAHVAHLYTVANGQIPQTKYLLASKDDYVVDGHHNWAADVALALNDPSQKVPILRIDAPAREVISLGLQWATEHGFESVPLGKARQEAIEKADKKKNLNKKHSKAVKAAIIAGVVGVPLAIKVAEKAAINATTDALGIIARNAVTTHVAIDSTAMGDALAGIYAEASSAGVVSIASMLGLADTSAGKYIANVLQNSASVLNGIDQTTKEMIISALQDGLVSGNSTDQISTSINDVVDNPQRADLIAVTEVNRAYNAGIIDMLANSGATQFNWIVRENGCTVCSEQEGVHDIGDDTPPLHPNCQCDIGQVVEKSAVRKGDVVGHAFHGNQWQEGTGGVSPEKIKAACNSRGALDKLAEIFGNTGNYPTAGGCLVVAQAIQKLYPNGQMKAIVTSSETHLQSYAEANRPPMVQHFVVQIGKDRYLDAEGVQNEHELLTKYGFQMPDGKYSEQLIEATPFVVDHASTYILSPEGGADKFADFLRSYSPTTTVTKKQARLIKAVVEKVLSVAKGDVAGHEFHGNQWTGGQGSASLSSFKESFDKAFAGSPFSAFVNHYSLEEMKSEGMKPLLSADGKTGLLIHDHGDGRIEATALFNNGESGAGLQLLKNAIDNHGVNYVECFGPALPVMYGKLGFEVESKNSFDPQYAPTDWNYDKFGTPDYYTMRITK